MQIPNINRYLLVFMKIHFSSNVFKYFNPLMVRNLDVGFWCFNIS